VKVATVVELDIKEIRAALFALGIVVAKAEAKAEAGGSSISFVIDDGELQRAIVRFGNRLTDEQDEPEFPNDQND